MTFPVTSRDGVLLLLKAAFLGAAATLIASLAGALVLSLFTIFSQGADYIRILLPALFYSLFIGPVLAWPATLVVLPLIWLLMPDQLAGRRVYLLVAGALSGTASIYWQSDVLADFSYIDASFLAAGFVGGATAGLLFGLNRRTA